MKDIITMKTIKVSSVIKKELDKLKIHSRETYSQSIGRLISEEKRKNEKRKK